MITSALSESSIDVRVECICNSQRKQNNQRQFVAIKTIANR